MKFLVDIGHPAHVHLFKNFILEMKDKGHHVITTIKDDRLVKYLLKKYEIDYIDLGKKGNGIAGKFLKQFIFDLKILFLLYRHNIHKTVGTSVSISHASLFHSSRSYVFNEDDVKSAPLFAKLAYPFSDHIITPTSLKEDHGKRHTQLETLHELAYLHPETFEPDNTVLKEIGLKDGEKFFIFRFNELKAHHDKGIKGISFEKKIRLIKMLEKYGRVLITAEGKLEKEFEKYRITVGPEKIHDLLFHASMFIGDSQSMTIESAVLGTPAIRCNDFVGRCPAIEELEDRYGLTFGFKPDNDDEKMVDKIKSLLDDDSTRMKWAEKRKRLLEDKINLNRWMVDNLGKKTK